MANRSLEHVLAPDYLDGLDALPIEELRSKRAQLQGHGDAVSYLRRLVQARLDIVGTEIRSRATGDEADLVSLVERLPTILAEPVARTMTGRLISTMTPPDDIETWASVRLERQVRGYDIERVPEMSDDDLTAMAEALGVLEREVSDERRQLHDRIDRLQAELIYRYKTGRATVEGLLA